MAQATRVGAQEATPVQPAAESKSMAQAMAEGAQEVTPVQPAAESKSEDGKESEEDVVSTLKKSQDAAAEREAGEQVPPLLFVALALSHAAGCHSAGSCAIVPYILAQGWCVSCAILSCSPHRPEESPLSVYPLQGRVLAAYSSSFSAQPVPGLLKQTCHRLAAWPQVGSTGMTMRSQKEITLKDDLSARDRLDIYRNFLLYCMSGDVVALPMGSTGEIRQSQRCDCWHILS